MPRTKFSIKRAPPGKTKNYSEHTSFVSSNKQKNRLYLLFTLNAIASQVGACPKDINRETSIYGGKFDVCTGELLEL